MRLQAWMSQVNYYPVLSTQSRYFRVFRAERFPLFCPPVRGSTGGVLPRLSVQKWEVRSTKLEVEECTGAAVLGWRLPDTQVLGTQLSTAEVALRKLSLGLGAAEEAGCERAIRRQKVPCSVLERQS